MGGSFKKGQNKEKDNYEITLNDFKQLYLVLNFYYLEVSLPTDPKILFRFTSAKVIALECVGVCCLKKWGKYIINV